MLDFISFPKREGKMLHFISFPKEEKVLLMTLYIISKKREKMLHFISFLKKEKSAPDDTLYHFQKEREVMLTLYIISKEKMLDFISFPKREGKNAPLDIISKKSKSAADDTVYHFKTRHLE